MNCTKIQLFLENSIAYQNQTLFSEKLQALLLSLKEQKTEDNSWFYCKRVQGMPLRTPPGAVVCRGRVDAELTGIQFNAALLKEKLQHRCFPVNLAKFLRTPYSQSTSGRLLLILFEACFSYFPLSKIFTSKRAASCEKGRLVENRLKMLSLKSFGDLWGNSYIPYL